MEIVFDPQKDIEKMVKQVLVVMILLNLFSCENKPVELTQVASEQNVSISHYKGNADSVAFNVPIEIHIRYYGNKIKFLSFISSFNHNFQDFPEESYIIDKKTGDYNHYISASEDYKKRSDQDLTFYKRDFLISNTEAKALLVHTKYKDLDLRKLKDTLMLKPIAQLRADCPNCFSRIDTIDYKIFLKYNRKGLGNYEISEVKVNWK